MKATKVKGRPNNVDKYAGVQLRKLRKEKGFSQEKLAERIGVTFQQVQKYEKGLNRIAVGRLYDIAVALNVSVLKFFP